MWTSAGAPQRLRGARSHRGGESGAVTARSRCFGWVAHGREGSRAVVTGRPAHRTRPRPVYPLGPMEERPRTTTRTAPSRPERPVIDPAGPLVVRPGELTPGHARGAAPLRREGPEKLTGEAKYADDLVFPGAWYGATIRSTDAHARLIAIDV